MQFTESIFRANANEKQQAPYVLPGVVKITSCVIQLSQTIWRFIGSGGRRKVGSEFSCVNKLGFISRTRLTKLLMSSSR